MPSVRLSLGRRGPVRRGLAWAGVYWRRTDVSGMVVYKNNLRCVAETSTRATVPGGQYEELDCLHLGGIARVVMILFHVL
ncbi:unnamed protein product [Sphagnum jensenii]|uniref:Uncharacterized protein n=1 Tax=Sphagnum jensenii TaxID=128206 RepID=A0ABP1AMW4_9BRYO